MFLFYDILNDLLSLTLFVVQRLSCLVVGLSIEVINLRILNPLGVVLVHLLDDWFVGLIGMLSLSYIVSLSVRLTGSMASSDGLRDLLV